MLVTNYVTSFVTVYNFIVNTIGTIDDLIEFSNKIIDKLNGFSDLIYQNYLINTAPHVFLNYDKRFFH